MGSTISKVKRLPSIYGDYNSLNTFMIPLLLTLCSLSCFFFHFTDSYKSPNEKIFYGFVTPKLISDFIENWINICSAAKKKVIADQDVATFEELCTHCEKEAVNVSFANLFTYPFVREAVVKGKLTLKGAHYNFVDCSLQLWDLDVKLASVITL